MTTYLRSKNRSVRLKRIQEKIFESIVCCLDLFLGRMAAAGTVLIFGLMVAALIFGIAGHVCNSGLVEVAIK